MKDTPIIFSAPMVRALLDGRKTQTRRILRPQPEISEDGTWRWDAKRGGFRGGMGTHIDGFPRMAAAHAPYAVGDRLWVRENWKPHSSFAGMKPRDMPANEVFYMADGGYAPSNTPWVPCIHMPRWASRLTLIVEGVKVERLQDISEEDALAEGVPTIHEGNIGDEIFCPTCQGDGVHGALGTGYGVTEVDCSDCSTAKQKFANLWASINGPDAWGTNPWVVAPTFRVERANIDALPVATPATA